MNAAVCWPWRGAAGIAGLLACAAICAQVPDPALRPGDDFFAFANDAARSGSVDPIAGRTEVQLAAIVQKAAQTPSPAGSDPRLAGDYYAAFMDEDGIEARGLHPLDALRTRIAAIQDRHEIARYIGETLRADVDALNLNQVVTDNLVGLMVAADPDAPDRYVPFLLQGGLGMPDRSYYLDSAPAMVAIRAGYAQYVAALLRLSGETDPDTRARRVVDLEQRIAAVHSTSDQSGDLKAGDNHWRRDDFRKLAPGPDWTVLFEAAGLPFAQHELVVWQPGAIRGIAALVRSEPVATWKDYFWVHAIEHSAQVLPKAFADATFAFRDSLPGAAGPHARWKRALAATNAALGDAVGRLYVVQYFPPENKAAIEAIAREVRDALSLRVAGLPWLSPQARTEARAKLAALQIGIGYPDQWRDYAGLVVTRNDAFGNAERAALFEYRHQLAKLGHRVDRTEWLIAPQAVSAVYLPAMNAVNIGAGLLQPPFYLAGRDPAQNYGTVGALIGQELARSFGDRGRRFDAGGRLHDWWTDADTAQLRAASERLPAGADAADLAGVLSALDAWHRRAGAHAADVVDGDSGEQRFFIAYAQAWRMRERDAILRNVDAWYDAFDVRPGQALYLAPAERVRIW
jgi:predicted metalloendopeptidase